LNFDLNFAGDDAREIQNVFDQTCLDACAALDGFDAVAAVIVNIRVFYKPRPTDDGVERRAEFVRNDRKKFVFGARGGFGLAFCAENLVLLLTALEHRHENAVVKGLPVALVPHGVDQHGNRIAAARAQIEVNFLDAAFHLQQREKMGLIKNTSGDGKKFFNLKLKKFTAFVAEQFEEPGVDCDDLTVIAKHQKSARRIF
jgi:hypothetical protein